MLELSPKQLSMVQDILASCVPDREIWAFGSRVKGTAKPYSDLDLVIMGETELPTRQRNQLTEAFQESDLSVRVDFIEWATISLSFRELIRQKYVVLQKV